MASPFSRKVYFYCLANQRGTRTRSMRFFLCNTRPQSVFLFVSFFFFFFSFPFFFCSSPLLGLLSPFFVLLFRFVSSFIFIYFELQFALSGTFMCALWARHQTTEDAPLVWRFDVPVGVFPSFIFYFGVFVFFLPARCLYAISDHVLDSGGELSSCDSQQ